MPFTRADVMDHIVSFRIDHGPPSQSDAATEKPKDRLSRGSITNADRLSGPGRIYPQRYLFHQILGCRRGGMLRLRLRPKLHGASPAAGEQIDKRPRFAGKLACVQAAGASQRDGHPSIDPELMIRMLIVGYFFAIRSERLIYRAR